MQDLRDTPGTDWSSVHGTQKQAMREALLGEQKQLCAYCMSPIPESTAEWMKVEHFIARAAADEHIFDWSNLLGVCRGEIGQAAADRTGQYHCDTHRGHLPVNTQTLHVHPASFPPDAGTLFAYTTAGEIRPASTIRPPESDRVHETIDRLNLNVSRLVRNRAGVLETFRAMLRKHFSRAEIERLLAIARGGAAGKLQPYAQVAVAYLEKKKRQI